MLTNIILAPESMHMIVHAIREHCEVFHNITPTTPAKLTQIGTALYAMNFIAARPKPSRAPELPKYKFCEPAYSVDKRAEQYRAVRSLRAVCNTEDLRQTTLFMALDTVYLRLALELADNHPAAVG